MADSKYSYLLFVSPDNNHNKFYEMKQLSQNEWKATYGRVGAFTPQTMTYPMSKWNSKYSEKVKKGYRDRTDEHVGVGVEKVLATKIVSKVDFVPISDPSVNEVVMDLISQSAQILKQNYTIELNNVTEFMLKKAQITLNELYKISEKLNKKTNNKESLEELNTIYNKIILAFRRKIDIDSIIKEKGTPISKTIASLDDADMVIPYLDFLLENSKVSLTPTVYKNIRNNIVELDNCYLKVSSSKNINTASLVTEFNRNLVELFNILPRKMNKVQDYLAKSEGDFKYILSREQNLYDTMEGAYNTKKRSMELALKTTNIKGDNSNKTVLEANGLEMRPCTADEIKEIKKLLGEISDRFSRAWVVTNNTTSVKYEKCRKDLGISRSGVKLLWHGSTTENWWSIMTNGLTLKPNARITGKMFGNGIYFAPKARKSLGYTSLSGSYWAHGGSKKGYMGIFEVACGKPYDVYTWSSKFYDFGFKDLRGGCTFVHAHAGSSLRNDEIIVYKDEQLTIKYLVELT